jgi:hypothetical protein
MTPSSITTTSKNKLSSAAVSRHRQSSPAISIPTRCESKNKSSDHSHASSGDASMSFTKEEESSFYEMCTWRMYDRIVSYRCIQQHGVVNYDLATASPRYPTRVPIKGIPARYYPHHDEDPTYCQYDAMQDSTISSDSELFFDFDP